MHRDVQQMEDPVNGPRCNHQTRIHLRQKQKNHNLYLSSEKKIEQGSHQNLIIHGCINITG